MSSNADRRGFAHLPIDHDQLTVGAIAAAVFTVAFFNGSQSVGAIAGFTTASWWAAGLLLARRGGGVPLPMAGKIALGALALYAALHAASLGWASDDGRALIEVVRTLGYLGLLVAVVVGVGPGRVRSVAQGLVAGLTVVALLALSARFFPGVLDGDQTRLLLFPDAAGRLGYPIAYWNGLGFLMAVLVLGLGWIGSTGRQPRVRAVAIAGIPLALVVLYLTGSRGGLLAMVAGIASLVALSPVRSRLVGGLGIGVGAAIGPVVLTSTQAALLAGTGDSAAQKAGLLVALVLIASAAVAAVIRRRLDRWLAEPRTPGVLRGRRPILIVGLIGVAIFLAVGGPDRLAQFDDSDATSDAGRGGVSGRFLETGSRERVRLWETSIDAFAAEPLHGIGAGAFGYYSNQAGKVGRPVRDAHSLYFESLAELGPLGLACVLALLGAAITAAARRTYGDADGVVAFCGATLVAALLGLGLDWLWEIPSVMGLIICIIGFLVGSATAPGGRGGRNEGGSLGRVRLAALAVVGVCAVALASTFILGEGALERSRDRAATDDFSASASAAIDAARLMPEDSRPWVQLGAVQQLAGDREGAIESLLKAVALAPEDVRPNTLLAELYVEAGDPRAEAQMARVQELSP